MSKKFFDFLKDLPFLILEYSITLVILLLRGILQTVYILIYMVVELIKWLLFQIYSLWLNIWWLIQPVAEPILKVVSIPVHYVVLASVYVLNDVIVLMLFLPKFFIIDFYRFLNKNYQVKARTIAFIIRSYIFLGSFLKKVFSPFYFVYMAVFYLNLGNFYVAYFWRPLCFVVRITLGVVLRILEFFIDTCGDICITIYANFRLIRAKIKYIWHFYRRKVVLYLRPQYKGIYYMNYLLIRFFVRIFLFIFLSAYVFFFLKENSVQIGAWWGPWSISSFLFFMTLYLYCFYYYCLRFWIFLKTYFQEYGLYFWCLACWAWISARFATPASWTSPSNETLKTLLGFWF